MSTTPEMKPHPAIGFTMLLHPSPDSLAHSKQALQRALRYFSDLRTHTIQVGETHLTLWGRGDLSKSCFTLPDGSVVAVIGSPSGSFTWQQVADRVLAASSAHPFVLPWEGRVVLLRIEPLGNRWTAWNDWVGSIPVYHARLPGGRIASTLEPVLVDSVRPGRDDIALKSLLALLMWGHYFSDWTLFKSIHSLRADSESRWTDDGFTSAIQHTTQPSEDRLHAGWDELVDEMHALSKNAILSVLKEQPCWILPLSSGLDSRLIAGVAAEAGVNVSAFTWGTPHTSDVIHSERIARALGIPWRRIDTGTRYLVEDRLRWADLFGSAMHFHGMYQMPFLDALREEPTAPILSGFIGDCMTGYETKELMTGLRLPYPYQIITDGYLLWTVSELRNLLGSPVVSALEDLKNEYENLLQSITGPLIHRLRTMIIWGRQHHFTYFQSWMSDYWRGVATPYINRDYARFSYSLPRVVLDDRYMQQRMLARYYPRLAAIPGSYAAEPAILTGSYLIKKRIARSLPEKTARKLFPGLYRSRSKTDVTSVRQAGKAAFQPVFESLPALAQWMNIEAIHSAYDDIIKNGNSTAVKKIQSIQAFAYRLNGM